MKKYRQYMGLDETRIMAALDAVWMYDDADDRRAFLLFELAVIHRRSR